MAAFYYTALRDLMSGHSVSSDYSFDGSLSSLQKRPNVIKKSHVTLGGNVETVVNRRELIYSASTIIEDGDDADQWLEFLSSVDGGEQFQVDINGTVASSDNIQNAILEGNFRETFITGSNAKTFSFTFRIV